LSKLEILFYTETLAFLKKVVSKGVKGFQSTFKLKMTIVPALACTVYQVLTELPFQHRSGGVDARERLAQRLSAAALLTPAKLCHC